MAENFKVKIEGLDEVKKNLQRLIKEGPEKADKIIEDVGEKIFADSQRLVPVLTGTLQISGNHDHTFLRSEIGYNTPYAQFVEEGTSKQKAQPYLRPAIDSNLPDALDQLEKILED